MSTEATETTGETEAEGPEEPTARTGPRRRWVPIAVLIVSPWHRPPSPGC